MPAKSRHDEEYEEEDRPRRKRRREKEDDYEDGGREGVRRKPTNGIVAGLIFGGVITVVVGIFVAVALSSKSGQSPQNTTGAGSRKGDVKPLQRRQDVESQLMGKSSDDVMKMLGRPKRTMDLTDHRTWYYDAATLNEATGKPDGTMSVVFEIPSNEVIKVRFH